MSSHSSDHLIGTEANVDFTMTFSNFLKSLRSGQLAPELVDEFIQNYPFDKEAINKKFSEMGVYFQDQNISEMSNRELLAFLNNNENPIVNKIKISILKDAFKSRIPSGIKVSIGETEFILMHLWES